jgi:hypothetical protein
VNAYNRSNPDDMTKIHEEGLWISRITPEHPVQSHTYVFNQVKGLPIADSISHDLEIPITIFEKARPKSGEVLATAHSHPGPIGQPNPYRSKPQFGYYETFESSNVSGNPTGKNFGKESGDFEAAAKLAVPGIIVYKDYDGKIKYKGYHAGGLCQ